jgi:hypothetical protein
MREFASNTPDPSRDEASGTPRAPCGRFSTGMERAAGSEGCERVGRYSDGIAAPIESMQLGRFSEGMETQLPRTGYRIGSYADGLARG